MVPVSNKMRSLVVGQLELLDLYLLGELCENLCVLCVKPISTQRPLSRTLSSRSRNPINNIVYFKLNHYSISKESNLKQKPARRKRETKCFALTSCGLAA